MTPFSMINVSGIISSSVQSNQSVRNWSVVEMQDVFRRHFHLLIPLFQHTFFCARYQTNCCTYLGSRMIFLALWARVTLLDIDLHINLENCMGIPCHLAKAGKGFYGDPILSSPTFTTRFSQTHLPSPICAITWQILWQRFWIYDRLCQVFCQDTLCQAPPLSLDSPWPLCQPPPLPLDYHALLYHWWQRWQLKLMA